MSYSDISVIKSSKDMQLSSKAREKESHLEIEPKLPHVSEASQENASSESGSV